ncbi:MAG: HU family DNA-binding protein [Clostridia bacterium]|nr:HU family DNA-binding protein [Clostridia bacterium]
MNKTELAKIVAEKVGISQKKAADAVNAVVDEITAALVAGDKVQLAGLGIFEVRSRAARTSRNPRTGESVEVAASKVPGFKASKTLKDAVNK